MTSRARSLAALGAYVCLAAHAFGLAHAVMVRHATCPTHGELVHGAAAVAPRVADDTAHAAPVAVEDADDHCLALANRRRDLAGLAPLQPQIVAPQSQPLAIAPATATRPSALPLLHLAPKTSPPTAV